MSQKPSRNQESPVHDFTGHHAAMVGLATETAALAGLCAKTQLDHLNRIDQLLDDGFDPLDEIITDEVREAERTGELVSEYYLNSRARLREIQACTVRRLKNAINELRQEMRKVESWSTARPAFKLLPRCANIATILDIVGIDEANLNWQPTPPQPESDLGLAARSAENGMNAHFCETVIYATQTEPPTH